MFRLFIWHRLLAKTLLPRRRPKPLWIPFTNRLCVWHNCCRCGKYSLLFFLFFPLSNSIFMLTLKKKNKLAPEICCPQDFVHILFVTFFLFRIIFQIKNFCKFHSYSLYYNFVYVQKFIKLRIFFNYIPNRCFHSSDLAPIFLFYFKWFLNYFFCNFIIL